MYNIRELLMDEEQFSFSTVFSLSEMHNNKKKEEGETDVATRKENLLTNKCYPLHLAVSLIHSTYA